MYVYIYVCVYIYIYYIYVVDLGFGTPSLLLFGNTGRGRIGRLGFYRELRVLLGLEVLWGGALIITVAKIMARCFRINESHGCHWSCAYCSCALATAKSDFETISI